MKKMILTIMVFGAAAFGFGSKKPQVEASERVALTNVSVQVDYTPIPKRGFRFKETGTLVLSAALPMAESTTPGTTLSAETRCTLPIKVVVVGDPEVKDKEWFKAQQALWKSNGAGKKPSEVSRQYLHTSIFRVADGRVVPLGEGSLESFWGKYEPKAVNLDAAAHVPAEPVLVNAYSLGFALVSIPKLKKSLTLHLSLADSEDLEKNAFCKEIHAKGFRLEAPKVPTK